MNGNTQGVIPTFDVSGNGNNNGWGGSMGEWIIGLVALGMLGNGGLFGGFGGGNGMYEFPWLLAGQNGINNNTDNGFDNLHLSNQIEGTRDAINNISTQLCNGFNGLNTSILTSVNDLNTSFLNCCCENRLANCQTQNTIVSEAAATRFADANNTRDIITSQTQGTQAILDKLCQLELDGVKAQVEAKNDRIAELTTQLNMANLAASQTGQTAQIIAGQNNAVNSLVNELRSCPIPAQPVYGSQPIFTCPNNNGCGCGYNTTSQFI